MALRYTVCLATRKNFMLQLTFLFFSLCLSIVNFLCGISVIRQDGGVLKDSWPNPMMSEWREGMVFVGPASLAPSVLFVLHFTSRIGTAELFIFKLP